MFKYTKEDLLKMSLQQLRTLDITCKEEEDLVQSVVSLKIIENPPAMEVDRRDVPDIKTKEEEEKWQKIIDERTNALKPKIEVKTDNSGIEINVENPVYPGIQIENAPQGQETPKVEETTTIEEKPVVGANTALSEGFKCEVCGEVKKTKLGLSGHKRKHKAKQNDK